MTTRTELLEIIANGENSGVEFKRDDLPPLDLAKELVAFSNLAGGVVLLGVEDDGAITGLARPGLEEWVMGVCRDRIRPAIKPFFEVVPAADGDKDIAVVRVTRGYGVHALWHNNIHRYLMRVGSQCREANREELGRLFQQVNSSQAELRPVSGAAFVDLDRRRLRNYFCDLRQQDVPADEDAAAWNALLNNTGFMTEEGVTAGGMLLFGTTPNRFLPHAGIDAAAYSGTEKDDRVQERAALRGPMTPLLNQAGETLENGLVEQALDFAQRNTRLDIEANGGKRADVPVWPRDALRESIVNALIHRDCLLTCAVIELAVYSDRLEVISPGRLPHGITPERMQAGARVARNQLLRDVMRDYRYLDHMGMGMSRIIIRGMREHNGTEPDLVEQGDRFKVRLFARRPKQQMAG